jgi:hypothetical protein
MGSMITDNTRYGVNAALVTDGNCIAIGPNRTRANTSGDVRQQPILITLI